MGRRVHNYREVLVDFADFDSNDTYIFITHTGTKFIVAAMKTYKILLVIKKKNHNKVYVSRINIS